MKAPRLMNDRISQLPQPILHNILRYLPQEEAVRTCLLSKSWRYLGSTRPNFTMREMEFKGSKQEFINVLKRYLQLYNDHKICPQDFFLSMSCPNSESVLFLDKWIPVLVRDWAVEAFSLSFDTRKQAVLFDLPSVVFESESLQSLYLTGCNLDRVNCFDKEILAVNLKILCLSNVFITYEILEKIICSCPLIELELNECIGLTAIRVDKRARLLKRFTLNGPRHIYNSPSLEIDDMTYFPLLKSLSLSSVRLSTESFGFFSHNFPCLETLSLNGCYGFQEFELSSLSIKKFKLSSCLINVALNRAAIDLPSIVMFMYEGPVPKSFSFTTTSEKWKSDITLRTNYLFEETSRGLGKLGQVLRSVSGSEMSLHIGKFNLATNTVSSFMNNLFCICRPRIIQRSLVVGPDSRFLFNQFRNQSTKVMCKILGMEKGKFESGRITKGRQWRQHLEKVVFETFDENEKKWHPVVERSWSKYWKALLPEDSKSVEHCMRFRLTWRE